ncbi:MULTISPECIES: exodeoxyribonuclease I [Pseudomonadaceae]|uniref:exodeoxyribonuclease I n=1 Tax=Pseudomonadaceae TaxID=135621 RepID=UPI0015E30B31|nr:MULTISPECIES: exodeoxyribonuclease I [unclassified Pseudomonas]MBA1277132.1 exodeoxyribonuclease I [Stutzerimonas stutzeri]MBC8650603.1 exodeoxyribonuclease I [Pseudomonas sp. MT4]QXY91622.1 exodeoxyribonuclease I [Pseudomonas sp. MTM4]
MTSSIFWYDFETTGISPRCDRPLQVAGIRTNEALEEIGEPLNIYCRLSDDILPHPAACLVTGITPTTLAEKGLCEAEFITRLHQELALPGTCGAGYNTLRFDDEVLRYSLYRNFFDPYAREWQSGNSRWDLIDLVRTAYALRPQGLVWPEEDGRVTLKLERLSAANGLEHLQAHDALSDVRATIALARLIRDRQPRLYDYLYRLRRKNAVIEQIELLKPMVHISGRFSAARHYLSIVLPLAWHPRNRNALIVCDLNSECSPLWEETSDDLRERLYTRREDLGEKLPTPLKLVHVNRCPVLVPMNVLRASDIDRLGLDLRCCETRARDLRGRKAEWSTKLADIYQEQGFADLADPEQQLYEAFLGERDRRLCEQVRNLVPTQTSSEVPPFDDARLPELHFRYRARNFPECLSAAEKQQWDEFCRQRLTAPEFGAPNTLEQFESTLQAQLTTATSQQAQLLQQWASYAQGLRERYLR